MGKLFIQKTAVTKATSRMEPETLMTNTIDLASSLFGGDAENITEIVITSQLLHCQVGDIRARVAKEFMFDESRVTHEPVNSNMQVAFPQRFHRMREDGGQTLFIGMESLGSLSSNTRGEMIGRALSADIQKKHLRMVDAIGDLTRYWMERFDIPESVIRDRFREMAIHCYSRAKKNPHSQFYESEKVPTHPEDYDVSADTYDSSGLLRLHDCCPGNTCQGAAMLVGSDEGETEIIGSSTKADDRPFGERAKFNNWPEGEAVFRTFQSVLQQGKISSDELMEKGILEIHNAFSPLILMTLAEMKLVRPDEMRKSWEEMGDFSKNIINASGGLSSGHALGATALVRIHEAIQQLHGRAPAGLQLDKKLIYALIQSVYGPRDKISMLLLKKS